MPRSPAPCGGTLSRLRLGRTRAAVDGCRVVLPILVLERRDRAWMPLLRTMLANENHMKGLVGRGGFEPPTNGLKVTARTRPDSVKRDATRNGRPCLTGPAAEHLLGRCVGRGRWSTSAMRHV